MIALRRYSPILAVFAIGCSTFGPKNPSQFTEEDAAFFKSAPGSNSQMANSNPDDSLVAMARFYADANRLPLAERMYEKALKANPKSVTAHIGLVKLYLAHNQNERAEGALQRAMNEIPNAAPLWNERAVLEARNGNISQAVAAATRARDLAPEVELYRTNLGNLLLAANRPDQAINEFAHFMGGAKAQEHVEHLLASMNRQQSHVRSQPGPREYRRPVVEDESLEQVEWQTPTQPRGRVRAVEPAEYTQPEIQRPNQGWRSRSARQVEAEPQQRSRKAGSVAIVDEEE